MIKLLFSSAARDNKTVNIDKGSSEWPDDHETGGGSGGK